MKLFPSRKLALSATGQSFPSIRWRRSGSHSPRYLKYFGSATPALLLFPKNWVASPVRDQVSPLYETCLSSTTVQSSPECSFPAQQNSICSRASENAIREGKRQNSQIVHYRGLICWDYLNSLRTDGVLKAA